MTLLPRCLQDAEVIMDIMSNHTSKISDAKKAAKKAARAAARRARKAREAAKKNQTKHN